MTELARHVDRGGGGVAYRERFPCVIFCDIQVCAMWHVQGCNN